MDTKHICNRMFIQSINLLSKCLISVSTDSKAHHPVHQDVRYIPSQTLGRSLVLSKQLIENAAKIF